jgi:serine/threonine protein kinase
MEIKERFQSKIKIGVGKYGGVYKAFDQKLGIIVAIKKIKIENEKEGIPISTIREVVFLKGIKHKNIIELLDIIIDNEKNKIYMILEFVDLDLRKFLDRLPKQETIDKIIVKVGLLENSL